MPIYAFKCTMCPYTYEEGMPLAVYVARREDEHNGFRHKTCGRCKRKGTIVTDTAAQARTLAVHRDEFTFYENAPDEILRGERTRTTTKAEAKALLKEHGMTMAGKEGKLKRKPPVDKAAIVAKWESDAAAASPVKKAGRLPAPLPHIAPVVAPWAGGSGTSPSHAAASAVKKIDTIREQKPKVVDIIRDPDLIMKAEWPTLKKVSRRLGLNAPSTTKRPELERLIRDGILNKQAAQKSV